MKIARYIGMEVSMGCGRKLGPYDCCSVVCGDCRDLMSCLPARCIGAFIIDPPFGINFKYESFDDTPLGYAKFISVVLRLAESKATPGAPFFVWQAAPNIKHLHEWFEGRDWRLFIAAKNFVQMRPTAMQWSFDPVVVWWTEGKSWSAGTASRDFHIGNTANTLNRQDGEADGHPCPRPLGQLEHIIGQWVRPEATVLDCFLGSGTTAVAAKKLGRHFLGFEISEEYCKIARKRIDLVENQPILFERKAEQMIL